MLGSVHDAEDIVRETCLRTHSFSDIHNPKAFFMKVAARLCLGVLGSAQKNRMRYVGLWLPEPIPSDEKSRGDHLQTAFLMVLEQLNPDERLAGSNDCSFNATPKS